VQGRRLSDKKRRLNEKGNPPDPVPLKSPTSKAAEGSKETSFSPTGREGSRKKKTFKPAFLPDDLLFPGRGGCSGFGILIRGGGDHVVGGGGEKEKKK